MSKEQQDKIWNELSEESKKKIIQEYNELDDSIEVELWRKSEIEFLFGEHNLNPKPQIKTWKDVEKAEGGDIIVDSKVINPKGRAWGLGLKYHQKAEATLKLAILIELGYGGMVSEEEWEDNIEAKYVITCYYKGEIGFEYSLYDRFFIAFHTPEQRQEFWSHESNRKLVEQYFMM